MPFKSKSQRRWMYANDPEMAKRWEDETPKGKKLPEKLKKKRQYGGGMNSEPVPKNVDEMIAWQMMKHNPFKYSQGLSNQPPNYNNIPLAGNSKPEVIGQYANQLSASTTQFGIENPMPSDIMTPSSGNPIDRMEIGQRVEDMPAVAAQNKPKDFDWKGLVGNAGVFASLLGSGIERGRQNKYLQENLGKLGRITPVPVSNFQPTPYNQYFQKGGAFSSTADRDAYRKRFTEVSREALGSEDDTKYLASLATGLKNKQGQQATFADGQNCINGICGLNEEAGFTYGAGNYRGRYISNTAFNDNVNAGKEDFYRVNGNFQVADHMQLLGPNGVPTHSMSIYDVEGEGDDAKYKTIHNGGETKFKEKIYSKEELENILGTQQAIMFRPGKSLDAETLQKERLEKTMTPEAQAAYEQRVQDIEWEKSQPSPYQYKIRDDAKQGGKDTARVMNAFTTFANDEQKINDLVNKTGRSKAEIHDSLLNVFGILGQENNFGSSKGTSIRTDAENFFEGIVKGKKMSLGPAQIKFSTLDPNLRKKFGINRPGDLYDLDKVIPLVAAIDLKNKGVLTNWGKKDILSEKLTGKWELDDTEVTADNIKGGVGRWSPYLYNAYGATSRSKDAQGNKMTRTLEEGSYPRKVMQKIDDNLERKTIRPSVLYQTDVPEEKDFYEADLQPVKVTVNKKKQFGGSISKYRK